MQRVITSFKKAKKDLLNAIAAEYPNGVEDDELVNFPKAGGGYLRALEITVGDTHYLVKMENEEYYRKFLAKEDEDDDDEDDFDEELDEDLDEIDEDEIEED
jgi:hypothetical protein